MEDYFALLDVVYGSPQRSKRRALWNSLNQISDKVDGPWIIAGDFNAILESDEKRGSLAKVNRGCSEFRRCLQQSGLQDMGYCGPKYTWSRGAVDERLDRACCNWEFMETFPNTLVHNLMRLKSDHRPI